jgi:hypothetical protein
MCQLILFYSFYYPSIFWTDWRISWIRLLGLTFPQQRCWGFSRRGKWRGVVGWVFHGVSYDRFASVVVEQSRKNVLDCWPLKMKALQSFETSGTTHTTQFHLPQEQTFRRSGYWVPEPGFVFAVSRIRKGRSLWQADVKTVMNLLVSWYELTIVRYSTRTALRKVALCS